MNINNAILHVFDFVSCVNVFAQAPMDLRKQGRQALRHVPGQARAGQPGQQARHLRREQPVRRGVARLFPRRARFRGAVPADRRVHRRRAVAHGEDALDRPARRRFRRRRRSDGARDDRRGGRGRLQGPRPALLRDHSAGEPPGLHARSGQQRLRRHRYHHRAAPRHSAEPVSEGGVVRAHLRRRHGRVVRGQGARNRW